MRARALALRAWHSWPVYCARDLLVSLWNGLPGPWPVKVLLILACQLIPGGFDEWALIMVTAAWRRYHARKLATEVGQ